MKRILSQEQREEIKRNFTSRTGEIEELVAKYGVSRSTICRIIKPDAAELTRRTNQKYMAEKYNFPDRYDFRITINPIKESEIYNKLVELESTGYIGARQHYIKQLIQADIQEKKKGDTSK